MKTSDFDFTLPSNLIAQYPPEHRGDSRLMTVDRQTGKWEHRLVRELPEILQNPALRGASGGAPLLVFNNSKVRKARLLTKSTESGAQAEFLLVEERGDRTWKALVQRAKRRRTGSAYTISDSLGNEINRAEITGEENEFCMVRFDHPIDDDWLDQYGHMPLPPYIKRPDTQEDSQRYQTVYASIPGSAAAPTAGLHFTGELLDELARTGIETIFITLHVGLGTFLPVRTAHIEEHKMHEEEYSISEEAACKIENARAQGRRIIAVGTTSMRTLESACQNDTLKRGRNKTSIFIYPGYTFKIVNALFTNFHTPESTLVMLVSAFAGAGCGDDTDRGRKLILECYNEAIRENYKFFSYGDAMLIV